jgi:exopolyphosphatase/guanosine-5'-triphosphate,3'-diphosphate pyrophosphatase
VDRERYREMEDGIARRLRQELPAPILASGARHLVGTAGTVTTLAALHLGLRQYEAGRVHGHRLTGAVVGDLLDRLARLSVAERAALPCLEPGRADLIVPGTAIVRAALAVTGTDAVVVSDWGLREGMMAAAIEGGG